MWQEVAKPLRTEMMWGWGGPGLDLCLPESTWSLGCWASRGKAMDQEAGVVSSSPHQPGPRSLQTCR